MKKYLHLSLFFTIAITGIVGCKKSSSGSSKNNGVHLIKFIELDTSITAPGDTIEEDTYGYDNLGRWTFESDLSFNINFPGIAAEGSGLTYANYYTGSNTLPYLNVINEYEQGILQDSNADYLLSYSSEGLLKDSDVTIETGYPNLADITTYQYNGSTIIETGVTDPPGGSSFDTVMQTKANGDVVSQVDNDLYQGTNFTASFDTHPDPFPDAQIPGFLIVYGDNIDFEQKNNLTEIIGADDEDNPVHTKYQYTYNANGYPATVMAYDWSSGSPVFVYEGIYFYQ
jgi:hypothetical protein